MRCEGLRPSRSPQLQEIHTPPVKLHLSPSAGRNLFTGYGDGFVLVNGERQERSVIVLPDRLIPWDAASFDELQPVHFEGLAALELEMLLLGTGSRLRFPHPRITAPLSQVRVGVEVMDVQAADRKSVV